MGGQEGLEATLGITELRRDDLTGLMPVHIWPISLRREGAKESGEGRRGFKLLLKQEVRLLQPCLVTFDGVGEFAPQTLDLGIGVSSQPSLERLRVLGQHLFEDRLAQKAQYPEQERIARQRCQDELNVSHRHPQCVLRFPSIALKGQRRSAPLEAAVTRRGHASADCRYLATTREWPESLNHFRWRRAMAGKADDRTQGLVLRLVRDNVTPEQAVASLNTSAASCDRTTAPTLSE